MSERYRWPWYWLVILAVLAIAGTAAIGLNTRSRLRSIDEGFATAQMLRLQRLEQTVDDYFAHATQLVQVGAAMSEETVGNTQLVRWYTEQIFKGRADAHVYGIGPFYAPGQFGGPHRLVNFYDHLKTGGKLDRWTHEHDGFDEVVYGDWGSGRDDYTTYEWYQAAVAGRGAVVYDGPYLDHGKKYISVVKAFYRHGKLAGVFTVDTLAGIFKSMLATGIAPGDISWIGLPDRHVVQIYTAPIPSDRMRYRDAKMRLLYSHAEIHLTSDGAPISAAERETVSFALVAIAAIWILAFITAIGLVQRWRAREATEALERDQERLETEIALARRVESELRKAAYTDTLTGLPNRLAFMDALSALLKEPNLAGHAIFMIDLDHFNITNETLGHSAGDELLRVIAARLADGLGGDALLARLGGDEFVVSSACTFEMVDSFARMILRFIADPVVLYGRTIYPHASIGVALVDSSYVAPEEVLRDADIAMYAAKARGRARYAVFDTDMREQVASDSELEQHLRRAIERGEIVPYYQPVVDLLTRRTASFEALARWHRDGEAIAASSFVAFAEARGFVHEIDDAMLRTALGQAPAIFALFPGATLALNVSAPELTTHNFAADLVQRLRDANVAPERIRLEITETTMMTRANEARETLRQLAENGIEVVLDDFGTGYSSLAYLQRLAISGLKIDRSFVEHIDSDERAREIVRSIVALAHALGLTTTAEGVERAAQVHELSLLGVKYGQGFFFSRAVPMQGLADLQIPDERPMTANRGE